MADDRIPGSVEEPPAAVVERLIFQRRSIRRFQDRPVPEAWIEAMLRCAHQAPSPSNRQPVRFVRIESEAARESLRRALTSGHEALLDQHRSRRGPARLRNRINVYRRYAEVMFAAPLLLAIGVSHEKSGFGDHLAAGGLDPLDSGPAPDLDITVGLALQGLMLKAQGLGMGSCVLTAPLVFIGDAARLLGLENLTVRCFLALGFPGESPRPSPRISLDAVVQVV